jgi:hypothetical protein
MADRERYDTHEVKKMIITTFFSTGNPDHRILRGNVKVIILHCCSVNLNRKNSHFMFDFFSSGFLLLSIQLFSSELYEGVWSGGFFPAEP